MLGRQLILELSCILHHFSKQGNNAEGNHASKMQKAHNGISYLPALNHLTSDLQHFSKWGNVVDVYFPGKGRPKRVNYCFVTFDNWRAAQRACLQSERSIAGSVSPGPHCRSMVRECCLCCGQHSWEDITLEAAFPLHWHLLL